MQNQMKQTYSCPKCDSPVTLGHKFCQMCGEKLTISCPHCGTSASSRFSFCTSCGGNLSEEVTRQKSGKMPSKKMRELLVDLHKIGSFLDGLPLNQRVWCNILGLYVQYRELDIYTHGINGIWVKVKGKYRSHLEAWTDFKEIWGITKYHPGNWESLVKPTLDIAEWLYNSGGLRAEDQEDFKKAVEAFRKEGKLTLP